MGQTAENFRKNLLLKIGKKLASIARPLIPSRTLRSALRVQVLSLSIARLFIPHYWALYVHDGRGSFGPRRARVLVWFRDPRNDPRTGGGAAYPVRASDIRRLTREEFYHGVAMNRQLGSPQDPMPYMVIARRKRGDKPYPFFSEGLAGADSKVNDVVKQEFERFWKSNIFSDRDKITTRF